MKVKDLIKKLSKLDPDCEVVVSWNYGDYAEEPLVEVDYMEKNPKVVCLWPH